MIDEVYDGGAAAEDARLWPGDHILKVSFGLSSTLM